MQIVSMIEDDIEPRVHPHGIPLTTEPCS